MQVARSQAGGEALMAITVDTDIAPEIVATVEKEIGAVSVRSVTLIG